MLLSPAKTLDFESKLPTRKYSEPRLTDDADRLIELLRKKAPADIARLMHLSDELAFLNATRYDEFEPEHTTDNSRPAALAFNGDVYRGLDAPSFDARDFTEAQKTTRILSGLYGLLRPLDLIQPYRLEMGTKLNTERGSDLYDWWGSTITDLINADLADSPGAGVVVNLASNEYFGSVQPRSIDGRVISPRFEDRDKNGKPRIVSFYAKRARGLMARWLIQNRVRTVKEIFEFDGDGYRLDADRSTGDQPIFVR